AYDRGVRPWQSSELRLISTWSRRILTTCSCPPELAYARSVRPVVSVELGLTPASFKNRPTRSPRPHLAAYNRGVREKPFQIPWKTGGYLYNTILGKNIGLTLQ